jgi:hypothetical protein
MFSRLFKTKTFYAAVSGIITGIGLIATGAVDVGIQTIIGSILALCLRDGIADVPTATITTITPKQKKNPPTSPKP